MANRSIILANPVSWILMTGQTTEHYNYTTTFYILTLLNLVKNTLFMYKNCFFDILFMLGSVCCALRGVSLRLGLARAKKNWQEAVNPPDQLILLNGFPAQSSESS